MLHSPPWSHPPKLLLLTAFLSPPLPPPVFTLMHYSFQPMPGLPKVLLFDSEALVWGGMRTSAAFHVNVSLISYPSSLYNSSQHPGFDVQPLYWCANTNNMTPVSDGVFSAATSAGLADSFKQISTAVEDEPAAAAFAFTLMAIVIMIEQSVTTLDVVAGGGAKVGTPLVLLKSPWPSQVGAPVPASLTLDLSGCLGCVSLANRATHVYIIDLCLTGLEQPVVSSGSNSSDGTQLSLPLWAFQFNRSSGSPSVTLYNVTLMLPQEEFRLLLAGLPAGQGTGAGGQQQLSLQGNVEFMVCGHLPIGFNFRLTLTATPTIRALLQTTVYR